MTTQNKRRQDNMVQPKKRRQNIVGRDAARLDNARQDMTRQDKARLPRCPRMRCQPPLRTAPTLIAPCDIAYRYGQIALWAQHSGMTGHRIFHALRDDSAPQSRDSREEHFGVPANHDLTACFLSSSPGRPPHTTSQSQEGTGPGPYGSLRAHEGLYGPLWAHILLALMVPYGP